MTAASDAPFRAMDAASPRHAEGHVAGEWSPQATWLDGSPRDVAFSPHSGHAVSVCSPTSAFHMREFVEDEDVTSPVHDDMSPPARECTAGSTAGLVLSAVDSMDPRVQLFVVVALWWSAAVYVTVMFKLTAGLRGSALPPFMLTGLVNSTTGLFALIASAMSPASLVGGGGLLPEWQWHEVCQVLVLGLLQGCELGFLNKSLEYLSVSDRTMLSNLNVLLVMAAAWFLGLERVSGLRVLAGLLLSCGGLVQLFDYAAPATPAEVLRLRGLAVMLLSMSFAAGKWTLVQTLTQRVPRDSALGRITKLQLAARTQPLTGLTCLLLSAVFEVNAVHLGNLLHAWVIGRVLLIAAGVTVIVSAELKVVQLTSAVACSALINVHHIPMALFGMFVFHDHVDWLTAAGFTGCILGGLCYAVARYLDPKVMPAELLDARLDSPHSGWRRRKATPETQISPDSPVNWLRRSAKELHAKVDV